MVRKLLQKSAKIWFQTNNSFEHLDCHSTAKPGQAKTGLAHQASNQQRGGTAWAAWEQQVVPAPGRSARWRVIDTVDV